MQRSVWFSGLALLAAGGLWEYQNEVRQNVTRSWEYAIVSDWSAGSGPQIPEGDHFRREYDARVAICYVQASGCKEELVEAPSSYPEYKNKENPSRFGSAQQAGVAKAIAMLGSAGQEMVVNGPAPAWRFDPNAPGSPVTPALYFKRVKP